MICYGTSCAELSGKNIPDRRLKGLRTELHMHLLWASSVPLSRIGCRSSTSITIVRDIFLIGVELQRTDGPCRHLAVVFAFVPLRLIIGLYDLFRIFGYVR